MRRALWVFSLIVFLLVAFVFSSLLISVSKSQAQPNESTQSTPAPLSNRDVPSCTLELKIEGAVTPATLDYLERGFEKAKNLQCRSIFLGINTPGGNLQTTRLIVEKILASPIPVLCLVEPAGGHAGSAGAIILLACHVNGAEPGTNIGAATPVSGAGASFDQDMRNKILQDTESWVKSLASYRGRNTEVAGEIVTKAKAVTASDAARLNLIDTLARERNEFLTFAEGRAVKMQGDQTEAVQVGALTPYEPDLRTDFLQLVTDPEIAYLMFMGSLALLFFEFTHPGMIAPGIAGTIGLIVSLISFHKLEVWWGGVALIAVGLGLLVAEAFVPSFGALGVGGIIAFAAGSVLLYDPGVTGQGISWSLILTTTIGLGALMLGLALLAFQTRRKGKAEAEVAILGRIGEVASFEAPSLRRGMIIVQGEYWRFVSDKDLRIGEPVVVVGQEGLTLKVKQTERTE